jgi:DNA-binding MarR family transcriptional regulator
MVAHAGRAHPSEIAGELQLDQSQVTRQVRALEETGHVEVTVDPADRRSYFVALSDAGIEEWKRLTEIGVQRFARFVASWTDDEVRTLTKLLWQFETSKADVARQEQPAAVRSWRQRLQPRAPEKTTSRPPR